MLNDPIQGTQLSLPIPSSQPLNTLNDVFQAYARIDSQWAIDTNAVPENQEISLRRFADSLFLLEDSGVLGPIDPDLNFQVNGKPLALQSPLPAKKSANDEIFITVDRSNTGYPRNWSGYLKRRWELRAQQYQSYVEGVIEQAFQDEAESILQLNCPQKIRKFLFAVSRHIYAVPYETYSRYLSPYPRFKSCDQTLDSVMSGDGGICAEKAMAFYFIAHAFGIPAELVLGGEDATGSFPYSALRSILNEAVFDFSGTELPQRYWQHYAVLCPLNSDGSEYVFCDVANSNIPPVYWDHTQAGPYLHPHNAKPLRVRITLEHLDLFYHRLAHRQDLPLDLYYAMEYYIDSMDLIQTVDNELGLLHTGDYWIGVIAHSSKKERNEIIQEHEQFVRNQKKDVLTSLAFFQNLFTSNHPLCQQFIKDYPSHSERLSQIYPYLFKRIRSCTEDHSYRFDYVIMKL